ncbi:MAG: cytochrome C [Planctomycetes bacterium]|nr:cytochrome C [Planctomycetota bacterium]
MLDADFLSIVIKADNVPITMMMYLMGFFIWLAFRQAAINDTRIEQGKPLIEAGSDDKVLVWPDLVYIELIALVLCMVLLMVWTVVLRAPLEQPANPSVAPNPAKAPWYFLGLQELLVYFDPWIAGVLLPGMIVFGLMAIPYIDRNPRGSGYYTFKHRPFAITMFMFGFVILWVMLIVFGTFLRGPNWNFFGPYEYWDPHRPAALLNINLSEIFWVQWLNRGIPTEGWGIFPNYVVREAPGIVLLLGYFLVLPVILRYTVFRKLANQMGFTRYAVMSMLFLWMALVPIKMVLRWTINFKYIVAITEYFLNV